MSYSPQVPPQDPEELLPFLQDEFFKVAQEFNPRLEGEWEVMYKLPKRVKPGMIQYFDGVAADPLGTGKEGLYRYGLDNLWHYIEHVPTVIPPAPTPGPWTPYTINSNWGDGGSNIYRKNLFSVSLAISAVETATSDNGQVLLTLPVGMRPPGLLYFQATSPSLGNINTLTSMPFLLVRANGTVTIEGFNKTSGGVYGTFEIPTGDY